jgi:LmbE family N-acetylglucosaminyl deacetylase
METTRRDFLKAASVAGLTAIPLVSFGGANDSADQKLKVICFGGHPDDPESGCGGTLVKLSMAGHDVNIVYLTRGEGGIEGKSHTESAAIRTKEASEACKILGAKPHYLGQVDGDTIVNREWIKKVSDFMEAEKPDLVFAHWPVDAHRDHQAASILAIQAWMHAKKKFQLYFYEVCGGEQTMIFHPTEYVDISKEQETKRKAIYCHTSQDPNGIYECGHAIMEKFRGREFGVSAAEAFIAFRVQNPGGLNF